MARILFNDLLGTCSREFHAAAPDLAEMLAHHDAALLIGDPALKADLSGLHVLDLAEGWRRLTGLPFVFAVWAVRPSIPPEPFLWSREYAKTHLDGDRRRRPSRAPGCRARSLAGYLDGNLHHDLAAEDEKGLAEFYRRAHVHGLLPSPDAAALRGRSARPPQGALSVRGPRRRPRSSERARRPASAARRAWARSSRAPAAASA